MLQSLFVYTFLAASMLWAAFSYSRSNLAAINIKDIRIIYIVLIYALVCGIRFDVGVDYLSYFNSYMSYLKYGISEAEISQEPGWLWFTKLLASRGFHFSTYFMVISFTHISLVVFAFKKYPKLLPYVVLMFFLSEWFILAQNVLRQITVTFIFLFVAVRYPRLPLYKTILLSLLAALIHTTGILIFLFIPFVKFNWNKIKIPPIVLIVVYISMAIIGAKFSVLDSLVSSPIFQLILAGTDYQNYMATNRIDQLSQDSVGLGFLLNIIVRCIVFSQYNRIALYYPEIRFKNYFFCYYIGLVITVLFPTSILFTRLFWFFTIMTIPVFAVFFKYCFDKVCSLSINTLRFQLGTIVLVCLLMLSATSLFVSPKGGNMTYKFYWSQKQT